MKNVIKQGILPCPMLWIRGSCHFLYAVNTINIVVVGDDDNDIVLRVFLFDWLERFFFLRRISGSSISWTFGEGERLEYDKLKQL